ncbi:ADP-ribosyl-[dinitrogen reductase] hydrolase [Opitutaceae bacterium EW11]|nr:ADP-ribosyl-[dinitrogen reductase] hydrolase [Opitutaceae bacterium EW11]
MTGDTILRDRALGAYLGLAIGDALGATVEFMTPLEIRAMHREHRSIVGGGWLGLRPGQVTDDTQMCLALGGAVLVEQGWRLGGVADAFVAWMRGRPADIGNTCRRGLRRYMQTGELHGKPAEEDAGNGAAMRNLPVVLATLTDAESLESWSLQQARITHWNELSDAATLMLAKATRRLVLGGDSRSVAAEADELVRGFPTFRYAPWPGRTSGYIVDTVQTVLEGFFSTASFEDCLVRVVNRGGDADTTGALAGQLAGALYGASAIPERWLKRLDPTVRAVVEQQTDGLLRFAFGRKWGGTDRSALGSAGDARKLDAPFAVRRPAPVA